MDEQALESKGTTIFILGLLSLLLCQLLGPVALIMGNSYVRDCHLRGIEPSGLGQAGRILGMVSTGLMVLVLALYGLSCCIGGGLTALGV